MKDSFETRMARLKVKEDPPPIILDMRDTDEDYPENWVNTDQAKIFVLALCLMMVMFGVIWGKL